MEAIVKLAYLLEAFRALRGRPTFRTLTASRSFGSISHAPPTLTAFRRLLIISARTLASLIPSLRPASVVPIIFMQRKVRNYYGVVRIILTSETPVSIVAEPTKRAGWQVLVTLANPTQPIPTLVKNEESTMPDNTITSTHGETPFATVQLTPNEIQRRDWAFLREWANNL